MTERYVSIVIVGARGRMGQALTRCVLESDDLTLVGAVDRSDSPGQGEDVAKQCGLPECGVRITDELRPPRSSVVVDFSLPGATDANVRRCLEAGVPLVLGTTGIGPETRELLKSAGHDIPIVSAANFSVGLTLLLQGKKAWIAVGAYARLDRLADGAATGDPFGKLWIRTLVGIDL